MSKTIRKHGTMALLLAALALLGGCALPGVTVSRPMVGASDANNDFDFAAAGGDFTVVVVGNPYGGDNAAFSRRVTTILNQENALQRTNFTTEPGPGARRQYRAVFVFNAPRTLPNALCENPQSLRGGPQGTSPITVQAGFCNGTASVVDVFGSVSGGDDAQLRALIVQVQNEIFPSRSISALRFLNAGT